MSNFIIFLLKINMKIKWNIKKEKINIFYLIIPITFTYFKIV